MERWTTWEKCLHGAGAARMKSAEKYRVSLVAYGSLDCPWGGLCAINEAGEGEAKET